MSGSRPAPENRSPEAWSARRRFIRRVKGGHGPSFFCLGGLGYPGARVTLSRSAGSPLYGHSMRAFVVALSLHSHSGARLAWPTLSAIHTSVSGPCRKGVRAWLGEPCLSLENDPARLRKPPTCWFFLGVWPGSGAWLLGHVHGGVGFIGRWGIAKGTPSTRQEDPHQGPWVYTRRGAS